MLLQHVLLLVTTIITMSTGCNAPQEQHWIALFNGKDLTDWQPKITGYALGDNFGDTFIVEDGLLKVQYAAYDSFNNRFGHLFYNEPLENYHLRIEYRFTGDQVKGGPEWALRNSGVMFHCQSPLSMGVRQDFPISLEGQFLGGNGVDERSTMNLCTPGTNVVMDGALITNHCINSTSTTFHLDSWVLAEVIATENDVFHLVNGDTVLQYTKPQVGGGSVSGFVPAEKVDGQMLTGGYIALQSESHPIEFRRVEVRYLDNK